MFFKKRLRFKHNNNEQCIEYRTINDLRINGKLFLSPDITFDVEALGNLNFFKGTIKFLSGLFSINDLENMFFTHNDFNQCRCFFINSTELEFNIEKFRKKYTGNRIVVITDKIPDTLYLESNFLKNNTNFILNNWLEYNNITIITGFRKDKIDFYQKNYLDFQNNKCCFVLNGEFVEKKHEIINFFYENNQENSLILSDDKKNTPINNKIKFLYLQSGKDEGVFNIYKNQHLFLRHIKMLSLFKKKYIIAIVDFGFSNSFLSLMKYYFNIIVVDGRQISELCKIYKKKSQTLKIGNKKISAIILSDACKEYVDLEKYNIEDIKNICTMNIPIIGFGFGGELLCEALGGEITNKKTDIKLNTYEIRNNENKFFKVSKFNDGFISVVPNGLSASFYDNNNHNIVCCESRKYFCCGFDLMYNNIDTVYIMYKIFNKIRCYIK